MKLRMVRGDSRSKTGVLFVFVAQLCENVLFDQVDLFVDHTLKPKLQC